MSYGFGMFFKQVNSKKEAFEYAMKFTENVKKNAKERILNAKYYIPSLRDFGNSTDETDKYWLYSCFTNNFTYWEKYNILGVLEQNFPEESKKMFPTLVYFQNSTDQNYEYECWGAEIYFFQEVIKRINRMSYKELFQYMIDECGYDKTFYHEEEIKNSYNYYLKSIVYETIFKSLDLDVWMDDESKSEKFIRFNLCAINGGDEFFKLHTMLKVLKKEILQEMEK